TTEKMTVRRCSRKNRSRRLAVMPRLHFHPPPATGCVARCTPCAPHPLCSKPGSALCANRRDSNFLDRSLQSIPSADRNSPELRGSARGGFARCRPRVQAQRASESVYPPFLRDRVPIRLGDDLIPPARVFVFRSAPAGA